MCPVSLASCPKKYRGRRWPNQGPTSSGRSCISRTSSWSGSWTCWSSSWRCKRRRRNRCVARTASSPSSWTSSTTRRCTGATVDQIWFVASSSSTSKSSSVTPLLYRVRGKVPLVRPPHPGVCLLPGERGTSLRGYALRGESEAPEEDCWCEGGDEVRAAWHSEFSSLRVYWCP